MKSSAASLTTWINPSSVLRDAGRHPPYLECWSELPWRAKRTSSMASTKCWSTAVSPQVLKGNEMAFSLEGQTVFITGAAGGIGSATAKLCASMGARLVLADLQAPGALAQRLRDVGTEATAMEFDVRDRQACEQAIAEVGRFGALVANAGYCPWDGWHDGGW